MRTLLVSGRPDLTDLFKQFTHTDVPIYYCPVVFAQQEGCQTDILTSLAKYSLCVFR